MLRAEEDAGIVAMMAPQSRAVAIAGVAATGATATEVCRMQGQLPPLCGPNILVTVLQGTCRVRCQAWVALRAMVHPFGIHRLSVLQVWEVMRRKRRRKRRRNEPTQAPPHRHPAHPSRTGGRRCGSKGSKAVCGLECTVCRDRCPGRCQACGRLVGHSRVPILVATTVRCQAARAYLPCRLLQAAAEDNLRLQAGTSTTVKRLRMDPICRSSSSLR